MAIFNMVGGSDPQIGDLKDSVGTVSSRWLECNGAGVNSSSYPNLVSILQTTNPTGFTPTLPKTYYASNVLHYATGAYYYNGRWVVICNGYNSSTSTSPNKPVVYTTTDLYGSWTEVKLADSGFFMCGVTYNARWGDWIVFGYKYISSSECYPYIFYTADPTGSWAGYQVSNTNCKITTGLYADGKFVMLGKGASSTSNAYSFVCTSYAISFTERNYSTSHSGGIRTLAYGNGYWAYADNSSGFYYTGDLAGTWTKKTVISSGVQCRTICYGNGTWCLSGMQNSGGSGRMFYATDLEGTWTNLGVFDVNQYNDSLYFSDGVWLTATQNLGGGRYYYVSTDSGRTWTKKEFSHGTPYGLTAYGGKFVLCTLNGINIFRRPQYDAPLPELTPTVGKTYIKAK